MKCSRHNRRICLWCASTFFSFPFEHLAWERLPYLSALTRALGL
jgi:hypothetical protein